MMPSSTSQKLFLNLIRITHLFESDRQNFILSTLFSPLAGSMPSLLLTAEETPSASPASKVHSDALIQQPRPDSPVVEVASFNTEVHLV